MIEAEQRTAQEQERLVDLLASLITDRQPPILRYPRQRPLHYPPVPPQLLAALYLLPGYAALDAALLERPESPPDAHSQALSAPSRLNGDTTAIDCHNCQIDCQAQREQKGVRRSGGEAHGRARDRIGPSRVPSQRLTEEPPGGPLRAQQARGGRVRLGHCAGLALLASGPRI